MLERRTTVVRATQARALEVDVNSDEWEYRSRGLDPEVTLIGGAVSEEKTAPNYSDYLRNKET